jgi:glucose/mannose-6-phosphate isomerase
MLDDLKLIHERDKSDLLGIIARQWKQLSYEFEIFQDQLDVDNIVYAGMGGSAIAGLISTCWPGYAVPFEILRGYDIPQYVNERTYFIASSYSGNTEETINALAQAEEKGAQIAVMATGGKLVEIAENKGYSLALLPKAEQARYGVLYSLKALLIFLEQAGLSVRAGVVEELEGIASFLQTTSKQWLSTVPTDKNLAKKLALEIIGKSVVIYSGPKLWPAAYKWKITFNENAKHIAWVNQLPEFNHNEFMGWTEQPVEKPYTVIDIRSKLEHPRILKRFAVTERLLSGKRPASQVIEPEGDTLLKQILWTMLLADYVSVYTALLAGIDPAPVALVDIFKKNLED